MSRARRLYGVLEDELFDEWVDSLGHDEVDYLYDLLMDGRVDHILSAFHDDTYDDQLEHDGEYDFDEYYSDYYEGGSKSEAAPACTAEKSKCSAPDKCCNHVAGEKYPACRRKMGWSWFGSSEKCRPNTCLMNKEKCTGNTDCCGKFCGGMFPWRDRKVHKPFFSYVT